MITTIDLSSDDENETTSTPKGMSVATTTTTKSQTKTTQRKGKKYQQYLIQDCQTSQTTRKKITNDTIQTLYQKDSDFIDHVVMIWLHRVRKGYRNIEMPDNILKAKANEAANLMKMKNVFCENTWLKGFQEKMRKMREEKQIIETFNSTVFRIEAIMNAEKYNFYKNYNAKKLEESRKLFEEQNKDVIAKEIKKIEDKQQKQLEDMLEGQKKHLEWVKESQRQQIARIKYAQKLRLQKEQEKKIAELQRAHKLSQDATPPTVTKSGFVVLHKPEEINNTKVRRALSQKTLSGSEKPVTLFETIEVDDVLDEPLQSYEEALDCLGLVENYFLSTRNLKAAMFVDQIESFIKQEQKLDS